jgi:hypothetical protein
MDNLIKNIREMRDLKQTSINLYIKTLKNLHSEIYEDENFNNVKWLKDYSTIMDTIKDKNYLTQRNILNAVIVALSTEDTEDADEIILKYTDIRDNFNAKYVKDVKNRTNEDICSKKQLDETIDEFEKLIKFKKYKSKKELTKKELSEFQMFIILKFHQKYPLRADIPTFIISTEKQKKNNDNNYYNMDTGTIVLNDYKTSSSYGQRIHKLDKQMKNLFNQLIKKRVTLFKKNNDPMPKYLIIKQNKKTYQKNEYSSLIIKWFQDKINMNIGCTALRRIYLEKYKDVKKEMNDDAKMMLHGIGVQQNIYVE